MLYCIKYIVINPWNKQDIDYHNNDQAFENKISAKKLQTVVVAVKNTTTILLLKKLPW